jgi:hypothetical protein
MGRPTKIGIRANAEYLKSWDIFHDNHKSKFPILLPLNVSIEDGIIARDRIKSGDLAKMRDELLADFKEHCHNPDGYLEGKYNPNHFKKMLDDYIKFFVSDNQESAVPPNPLDLSMNRPVWILFRLPRKNWKFTKRRQFSTENDRDDFARNFEKITTLDNRNILLLANHCRSSPKNLKYNLHVTISQRQDGKRVYTDIIIDPGSTNGPRGNDEGQSLP